MKRSICSFAAAGLALALTAGAAGEADARHWRGRHIVPGIAAGIIGGVLLHQLHRDHYGYGGYYGGGYYGGYPYGYSAYGYPSYGYGYPYAYGGHRHYDYPRYRSSRRHWDGRHYGGRRNYGNPYRHYGGRRSAPEGSATR